MKKKISTFFLITIFCLGLSLILYPIVSNFINSQKQAKIIANYDSNLQQLSDDNYKLMLDEAKKYNEDLFKDYGNMISNSERYDNLLKINDSEIIGYIVIKKINIKLPIYKGTEDKVLQNGVGHLKESSIPIGGENSHSILLGHRGLPTSKLFSNLNKVENGDYFSIYILGEELHYKVDEINIIEPNKMYDYMKIDSNEDKVTLVTCTPYGINSHRLLVTGHRDFNYTENKIEEKTVDIEEEKVFNFTLVLIILIIIAAIWVIITISIIRYNNLFKKYSYEEGKKWKRK